MSLRKYLLLRILTIIPTMFFLLTIVYILIHTIPGNPVERQLQKIKFASMKSGQESNESPTSSKVHWENEEINSLKKFYKIDKTPFGNYLRWLKNLFTFNLGESFIYKTQAIKIVLLKARTTFTFGVLSLILICLISIFLSTYKVNNPGSLLDKGTTYFFYLFQSIPTFILGLLLLTLFSGGVISSFFPLGGLTSTNFQLMGPINKILDLLIHLTLPLLTFILPYLALSTIILKNSLSEELNKDYLRFALSKGLSRKTAIWKHALKNALIPFLAALEDFLPHFFMGSIIIETIFQIDGLGLLSYRSLISLDYNLIFSIIVFKGGIITFSKILVDFLLTKLNPRIVYQ